MSADRYRGYSMDSYSSVSVGLDPLTKRGAVDAALASEGSLAGYLRRLVEEDVSSREALVAEAWPTMTFNERVGLLVDRGSISPENGKKLLLHYGARS